MTAVAKIDLYSNSVFINCPFSAEYQPIFRALLFAILDCGFRPRCALEITDLTENRLTKIERIIEECKLGIHDISFMGVDANTKLARFNMPFEFGIFFAAKRFGSGRQKKKTALVLDKKAYRYRAALSDISGQDISIYNGAAKNAIREVRNWLNTCHGKAKSLPGGEHINRRYKEFSQKLPRASKADNLNVGELTYSDLCLAMMAWLKDNA